VPADVAKVEETHYSLWGGQLGSRDLGPWFREVTVVRFSSLRCHMVSEWRSGLGPHIVPHADLHRAQTRAARRTPPSGGRRDAAGRARFPLRWIPLSYPEGGHPRRWGRGFTPRLAPRSRRDLFVDPREFVRRVFGRGAPVISRFSEFTTGTTCEGRTLWRRSCASPLTPRPLTGARVGRPGNGTRATAAVTRYGC